MRYQLKIGSRVFEYAEPRSAWVAYQCALGRSGAGFQAVQMARRRSDGELEVWDARSQSWRREHSRLPPMPPMPQAFAIDDSAARPREFLSEEVA